MERVLKGLLIAVASVALLAGSAVAGSISSADYWTNLGRVSWAKDINEDADYESAFGLYTLDAAGDIDEMFTPFGKGVEAGDRKKLQFREKNDVPRIKIGKKDWKNFDSVFGFFYRVDTDANEKGYNYTFFTDAQFNQLENGTLFNTGVEQIEIEWVGKNKIQISLEDIPGVNGDFNDMVVTMTNVGAVPEPGTIILYGAGLAVLVGYNRRKKK